MSEPKNEVENFLSKFRDNKTRRWTNFTAKQFLDVWCHYDTDGNGYIEGEELDGFLREFISSVVPGSIGSEIISDSALQDMKEDFMAAYDENDDNRIEIGELAQMLPTDENFLLLFRRNNPLDSSVDFMKIWRKFDTDNSGYIEANELKEFLAYLLAESNIKDITDEKLEEYSLTILKLFDENGDGKLQLSEMARLLPVKENYLSKPLFKNVNKITSYDIDKVFKKYDADKNGTIENEELQGLLKDLLELAGESYDEEKMKFYQEVILGQWDLDHDGKIGRDELKMILLQQGRMADEEEMARKSLENLEYL